MSKLLLYSAKKLYIKYLNCVLHISLCISHIQIWKGLPSNTQNFPVSVVLRIIAFFLDSFLRYLGGIYIIIFSFMRPGWKYIYNWTDTLRTLLILRIGIRELFFAVFFIFDLYKEYFTCFFQRFGKFTEEYSVEKNV